MPPRRPDPYRDDPEASERPMSEKANSLDLIEYRLNDIQDRVSRIDARLERQYVTQDQLETVETTIALLRNIVFGLVGLILTAFAGALINLVIHGGMR